MKEPPFPPHLIAALGIINILFHFYGDIDRMVKAISPDENQKDLLKGIRQYSKLGVKYVRFLFFQDTQDEEPAIQFYKDLYSVTIAPLNSLKLKINELEQKEELWNSPENIIHSLIHLHCNRLIGLSKDLEIKARVAAFHFLEKISISLSLKEK